MNKPKNSKKKGMTAFMRELVKEVLSEKKKGIDGKACWKGYRYGGTKDGKDICTKVKKPKNESIKKETKEAPKGHYFTKSGNLVKGRMTAAAKERGARKSDPKDNQRSKVPPVTQYTETADPQDGKAAPYGSGFKKASNKSHKEQKATCCGRCGRVHLPKSKGGDGCKKPYLSKSSPKHCKNK